MKKHRLLRNIFVVALIAWGIMLVKQQLNIIQYQSEIDVLLSKMDEANEELDQNKKILEQQKENTNSLEYIEKIARERLGMYLQNERVYIDSNI